MLLWSDPCEPMRPFFRGLRAGTVFFTRIPLGGFPYHPSELRWSIAHLPLIGFGLGGIVAGAHASLGGLSSLARALFCLALSMLLTGAFHEDGLADTADALGGGHDRASIFRILKDSRVGTFGAAATVFSIGLRAVLVSDLGPRGAAGLVLALGLARCPPVWLAFWLPYVTPDDAAKSRGVASPSAAQVLVATLVALAGMAVAHHFGVPARALGLAIAGLAAVGLLCGSRFKARLGGVTGDFLGANEQLGEVTVLGILAATWSP